MLTKFGSGIWISDGPVVTAAAGFHYPTRMAVIRLTNGDLVLWSPVALTNELRAEIEALGRIRYLIAPNSLHHTFLADWHHAFPEAGVFAPPGLREKRPDIPFTGEFGSTALPGWAGEIDVVVVRGNRITTEAVFFHRASRTALFTDLLQQFPPGWFTGWRALVARLDLMVRTEPTVPRKFRLAFTDRAAAREGLRQILEWPTGKVLIAHGKPVTEDGQAFLKRAFRWLVQT
ncbi:DUF4336 domain-containing protein [Pseudotabrizicola alkalilacus]|uniref:DUF4336 domain-containing protein n=1 Tax=Pseudotabrizicola alkalilacus TaxID=2305252 RepID=A0A411YXQ8_9RHOB|nr:DUF4336 domain-containing protein [Pseudotabrizicola alkalilacus]RGP35550.1 DUF4336 domain-containing protein [Pseudotabrizicola alkalilacus]